MSEDYQTLVIKHYKKRRDENDLSLGLSQLSPAKLKKESFAAFASTNSKKDRKIFIDFFEESGDDEAALKRIKKRDASVFKPLLNFLRGETTSTDFKNIELLAWLTDFKCRPFEYGKDYSSDALKTNIIMPEKPPETPELEQPGKETVVDEGVTKTPPEGSEAGYLDKKNKVKDNVNDKALPDEPSTNTDKQRRNSKIMMAALAILMAAAVGFTIYLKNKGEGCMYWAGDEYQQIPCSQKVGSDTTVIALDMERLNSLKKITRPDTITDNSIGKVWYIKIDGRIEYYTAGGNYPLDPKLRLHPITDYIITKYIVTNQQDSTH